MAEEATTRRSHKRLWTGVAIGVVLLAAVVGVAWYLRSPSFEDFVRRKVVGVLEDVTGGRVEIASFHWNLSQLAFEADNLTIHGLEPPGERPYAHVDRAFIRLHIISFFERRYTLEYLELERPVVHVIVYPDGQANAPQPKVKTENNVVQEVFDLAIARADLRNGVAIVNNHRLPLDFAANDIVAQMSYQPQERVALYRGRLQVGKFDVQYGDYRDTPAAADLQFDLYTSGLKIESLDLISQQSKLHASGDISNFDQPQVHFTYAGNVDLAQLGAVMRSPQLHAGMTSLSGSLEYSPANSYSTTGHLGIRGLEYLNGALSLRKVNADTNYTLAQDRLELRNVAAHLFGGEVTGEADVKNLAGSATSQPAEQQGSARLRLRGLSLNELARTMSSRTVPLEKLRAVGSVSGSAKLGWRRSFAEGDAELALDIRAPEQAATNDLPVSGSVRGRYGVRSERLDLAAINLTTPHTHIEATGSLGPTTALLNLKATTSSLAEMQPVISGAIPVELAGEASFDGTLRGRLRYPEIAGHLQATDLTYIYTPATPPPPKPAPPAKRHWYQLAVHAPQPAPAPQPSQPRRIHFDLFSGDVQYSQSNLAVQHGVIQEGGAHLTVDGSATLHQGDLQPNSNFQLHAALKNGDVNDLQKAAGLSYPVQGSVSFTVQAGGTIDNPHAQGQASLTNVKGYGGDIKTITSDFDFANHTAEVHNLHVQAARGTVAGSLAYDFRSQEGKLDLKGESIDLADLPEIQHDHLSVAGVASFTAKGAGTLDRPVVNAHLEIANLVLNHDTIGTVTGDAVTQGHLLTLTARSNFPLASFTLDGNVELEGEMPANAVLRFANLDVNPFLPENVRKQVTRKASLDGQAQISGPLRQPRALHGTLNVQQFSVELEHLPVRSDGPVQLSVADEVVTIQRCVIVAEDTRFNLTGTAGLAGDRPLDLHANGSLNLKLAQTLDPDLTAYGVSDVSLNIAGTAAQPSVTGQLQVVHAGLSLIDLPAGLGDLNGTLLFTRDRLQVQNLTGRMGGGRVSLGGFVTYGSTLGFNLTLDGNDVRLRYSGISATSDQSLRLTGTMQSATLAGNITITRFAQIPSSDLQVLFSQANAPPSIPNPKSPLNNIHLEVRILSTPELTVETSLAKLSGDVDLRLRGTAARPVLLGRIAIAEGDIKLAGTKYHLERGDVTFINPVRIDPVLDVEATTRVRDYDITIGLHGTVERLNTTYRSDPPLSSDDIISLLAFGRTQTENALGAASSPGFAQSASGALLSSALNQAVTNRVSKIFGSSSIRINPSLGGPENDPNARLTLEQQVSNNITFTYITNLARSAQEVIQFEYNINAEYTLQGVRDENGVVSFDLLIRKRKP